jgi:hypothetical protein
MGKNYHVTNEQQVQTDGWGWVSGETFEYAEMVMGHAE